MKKIFKKYSGVKIALTAGGVIFTLVSGFLIMNEFTENSLVQKIISPVVGAVTNATDGITNFINEKYIHDETEAKILALEEENSQLRKDLIENTINERELQELKELKTMLNLKEDKVYDDNITANIIAKDGNEFYSVFLVSAGEKDGVKKGDLVLSGNGLAGVVEVVYEDYAKVASILDTKMSMSFKIVRDDEITGIASQEIDAQVFDGMENGLLKAYINNTKKEALVGDIVITSGMGIYPQGIEIGEVYEIVEDKSNLLKYIKIKPYTNFNKLNKVMIVNARIVEE